MKGKVSLAQASAERRPWHPFKHPSKASVRLLRFVTTRQALLVERIVGLRLADGSCQVSWRVLDECEFKEVTSE